MLAEKSVSLTYHSYYWARNDVFNQLWEEGLRAEVFVMLLR